MSDTPPEPEAEQIRLVQIQGNIEPQPIPTAVAVGHGNDGRYVLIGFKCAVGELNFFIPTFQMQGLIDALLNNAQQAQAKLNGGIIVAGPEALRDIGKLA